MAAAFAAWPVVAVARDDIDLHAQRVERIGDGRAYSSLMTVARSQEDAEDQATADDDLLDIEDRHVVAGQGVEKC